MSQEQELDFRNEPPSDPAQALIGLQPESLEFNRDELFFKAGYASGARSRGMRFMWPSAAAALMLICIGLEAALIHQRAVSRSETVEIAQSPGTVAAVGERSPADEAAWLWQQRLASPAPLPPGHLTAMGWIEAPPGNQEERPEPIDKYNLPPHRPSTYFELLRQQQEG